MEKKMNNKLKKAKKNRKLISITLILLFFSLSIFAYSLYLAKSVVIEKNSYYASVELNNVSGFDLRSEEVFTFGAISNKSSATRELIVVNDYGIPIIVEVEVKGEIANFIEYPIITQVNKSETKEIKLRAVYVEGFEHKEYEGKVNIIVKKGYSL